MRKIPKVLAWQHAIPQDDLDHEPLPAKVRGSLRTVCATCSKRIIGVGPDEGPETLKALLRF